MPWKLSLGCVKKIKYQANQQKREKIQSPENPNNQICWYEVTATKAAWIQIMWI